MPFGLLSAFGWWNSVLASVVKTLPLLIAAVSFWPLVCSVSTWVPGTHRGDLTSQPGSSLGLGSSVQPTATYSQDFTLCPWRQQCLDRFQVGERVFQECSKVAPLADQEDRVRVLKVWPAEVISHGSEAPSYKGSVPFPGCSQHQGVYTEVSLFRSCCCCYDPETDCYCWDPWQKTLLNTSDVNLHRFSKHSQVVYYVMSVMPAHGRLKVKDHEFEANLSCGEL